MDQARVEQLGAKAIEPELNNLKDVKTRDYFTALMGRTTTDFEFSLFTLMIYADLKDPHRYAFYLIQAGIGLPDRDYYLKPEFAAQKTAYQMCHNKGWTECVEVALLCFGPTGVRDFVNAPALGALTKSPPPMTRFWR
ncbi:MAG: hypothetical protein DMF44_11600 [Verrucomicrobia bacterium]|nr:MAG: hypothetical protein DMF44_11600 [Verrucomicrobiota bacterium]